MSDLFKLSDKVAIVTGGSKGIGRSIVEVFSQQKAIVHVLDIDETEGLNVVNKVNDSGGRAYFHRCDVSDHAAVEATFQKVFDTSRSLDILVNNAGIASIGSVLETSPEEMDKLYQVNVRSVYSCLHFGVKHMLNSGGGSIVNLASIASVIGLADRFAYSMSKGAVYTMTFSIAKDYIDRGIRCNAVGPARVHTPFVDGYLADNYPGREAEMYEALSRTQPIGRMGKPVEIAHLINYLCSDEAAFITGSYYPIDGGFLTLNT